MPVAYSALALAMSETIMPRQMCEPFARDFLRFRKRQYVCAVGVGYVVSRSNRRRKQK
jgi:hypothetical protein